MNHPAELIITDDPQTIDGEPAFVMAWEDRPAAPEPEEPALCPNE